VCLLRGTAWLFKCDSVQQNIVYCSVPHRNDIWQNCSIVSCCPVLNKDHRSSGNRGNQDVTHSHQQCELQVYIKSRYFFKNKWGRGPNGQNSHLPCECHAVTISKCHAVTILQCHAVTISQCHMVTKSKYHAVTISQCHAFTISQCHAVTLSKWKAGTISQYHAVTISQCHAVTISQCHAVSISQCNAVTYHNFTR